MTLFIDGDSCPKEVRELAARACKREQVPVLCVANRKIPFSESVQVEMLVVENIEGAADEEIVRRAAKGDLVLTRDIPLAARLVEAEVSVLNDRGGLYTRENVRERLSLRDFMADLNSRGLKPEATSHYGKREWDSFAATFDREFMKLVRAAKK